MTAIETTGSITSVRSKVDKSLSFSFSTPELSSSEKAAFMDLQGINVKAFIKPLDDDPEAVLSVHKEMENRTPSQRLRGKLYLLWTKHTEAKETEKDFDTFYTDWMESVIEKLKEKITNYPL